jgi:hypothetical protein
MKFDADRVTRMIEKLEDSQFEGQEGEANVADFIADQFTEMGLTVERREVSGSRFPQRVAPWVGWLVYGALITASYATLVQNRPPFMELSLVSVISSWLWLKVVLHNRIRIGRRMPPLESAPLLIARCPAKSTPAKRVVFQAVMGGLKTDFFHSLQLNRSIVADGFALAWLWHILNLLVRRAHRVEIRPEELSLGSVLFVMTWIVIVCVLAREFRHWIFATRSQQVDQRGLSVLLELARTWPKTRWNQVEALFVAAGGQRLDYAGSREVLRLLQSERPPKPTFLVLFFAPAAGGDQLVVDGVESHSDMKKLVLDAANGLWIPIPIRCTESWAIASLWPISTRSWPIATMWSPVQSIAIIGSDLNVGSGAHVFLQAVSSAIQLSSEIALRWAKQQEKPVDSETR